MIMHKARHVSTPHLQLTMKYVLEQRIARQPQPLVQNFRRDALLVELRLETLRKRVLLEQLLLQQHL